MRPIRLPRLLPALAAALAILLAGPAAAQVARPAVPAAKLAKPALIKVSDADTTIWLFGTFHMLPSGMDWFRGPVRAAFDGSSEVVLEVPIPDPDPEKSRAAAEALARDPQGRPLAERVPPELAARVRREAEAAGLPWAAVDTARPWFIAVTLQVMEFGKLGMSPGEGVEQRLAQAAQAAGKPVTGIETIESQLRLLASLDRKREEQFLALAVTDLGDATDDVPKLVAHWAAGDLDALGKLMIEETAAFPEIQQTVLYDRNRRFAEWIAARLARPGTVFVGVGAGHLAGDRSVQAMLRAPGAAIERVQ